MYDCEVKILRATADNQYVPAIQALYNGRRLKVGDAITLKGEIAVQGNRMIIRQCTIVK